MIQRMMSTWASPIIIVPKKGLKIDPENPNKFLPPQLSYELQDWHYRKLNSKLPADFWSYNKQGCQIIKQGINTSLSVSHPIYSSTHLCQFPIPDFSLNSEPL